VYDGGQLVQDHLCVYVINNGHGVRE
jgi:hypothetical protein